MRHFWWTRRNIPRSPQVLSNQRSTLFGRKRTEERAREPPARGGDSVFCSNNSSVAIDYVSSWKALRGFSDGWTSDHSLVISPAYVRGLSIKGSILTAPGKMWVKDPSKYNLGSMHGPPRKGLPGKLILECTLQCMARAPTFQWQFEAMTPRIFQITLMTWFLWIYQYWSALPSTRAVNQRNRHSFCYRASIEQPNIVVACLLVVMVTDRGFTIAQEWVLPAGTMMFYSGALKFFPNL